MKKQREERQSEWKTCRRALVRRVASARPRCRFDDDELDALSSATIGEARVAAGGLGLAGVHARAAKPAGDVGGGRRRTLTNS